MALSNPPGKLEIVKLININLANSSIITEPEHIEVENALAYAIFDTVIVGDIKEIAASPTYLADNFDSTGKAKTTSVRYGWAICNGANGTLDKRGRVSVGINVDEVGGASTSPLYKVKKGTPDGEVNVTLTKGQMPKHSHTYQVYGREKKVSSKDNDDYSVSEYQTFNTGDTGGGSSHNNMQPYVVSVFIQRIADY